jgi:serine/threonine-protein kinase
MAGSCPECGTDPAHPAGVPPAPGARLGDRFELVRPLGKGGLGAVWLALDHLLEREPVACKLLHGNHFHDKRALADLKREVLLARRLRHPHILAVHTFWESGGHRFVVMEYVAGQNLDEALSQREVPFTLDEVLPWVEQLAGALDYAHEEGVLHRDIKPANVLLDTKGMAHLADFGIARTMQELTGENAGELTCGTLLFMSPEQLAGEMLDARSDLYSLAASVYELLAGFPPFHTGSIVNQIQLAEPPPVAHLPAGVNSVLLRALAKDRNVRHNSCGAFFHALAEAARLVPDTACARPAPISPEARRERAARDRETVVLPARHAAGGRWRLGSILRETGVVRAEQIEEAFARQEETNERLGAILIALGHATDMDIARALSRQLRLPFTTLESEVLDPSAVGLVSRGVAEQRLCLPVRWEEGALLAAMADPTDLGTLNELEATAHCRVRMLVAAESQLRETIRRTYAQSA